MAESDKGFSNAPRSKSWKGVTRTRPNRTTGSDVSGGSSNVFRVVLAFFRERSKRSSNKNNINLGPTNPDEVHTIQGGGDRGSARHYNYERAGGDSSSTNRNSNRRHRPDKKRPCNAKGNFTEALTDRGSTPASQVTPEHADVKTVSRKSSAESNGADTDSPSSCSSLGSSTSAGINKDDAAVCPGADPSTGDRSLSTPAEAMPPLYETLFPLGRSAEEAVVDAKAEDSATIAAAPAFVKAARSRSDRHVLMRGTASARQRASVSFRRMLNPSNEISTSTGFYPPPPANDTAAVRAAYGKKGPLFGDVFAGAPCKPKKKVMLHDEEKIFIRSLREIDVTDWNIIDASPSLLGADRDQNYAPMASPQAATWGLKGMRHDKSDDRMMIPVGAKKTLVLDLDETLISSRRTPCSCDYKIVFKVHNEEAGASGDTSGCNADAPPAQDGIKNMNGSSNGITNKVREVRYYIRLRPGIKKFLEKTSALYELVVWTASGKTYADAVINLLDPDGKYFSYRLYREACTRHKGLCVKDLRRLGRPMDSVILLDNYVYSFGFTLDNGIPISPWIGNEEAKESGLKMAYTLLKHVARVPDVRVPLITAFDLYKTIHGARRHLPLPSMPTADVSTSSFSRTPANAPSPLAGVFASSPGALSAGEVLKARAVVATALKQ